MKPCPLCRAAVSDDVVFAPGILFCGACGRNAQQVQQAPSLPPGAVPYQGPEPSGIQWPAPPPLGPQPGQPQWPPPGTQPQYPPPGGQPQWPPPGGPQIGSPQGNGPQIGGQASWVGIAGGQTNAAAPGMSPQGLNWGAFLIPFVWGPANKVWIGLIALIGFIPIGITQLASLGVAIYLLIKGNELAWRSGRAWQSEDQFRVVQKQWVMWGLIGLAVQIVIAVIYAIALANQTQYVPVQ